MGTNQSSLAKSASSEKKEEIPELEVKLSSERGRSVNHNENIIEISLGDFETDDSDDEISDDESVDEEEEEERLRILEDAKNLKALAVAYLHPELPVVTSDPTVFARCYFDRPSAPEQEDVEAAEYRRQVLADAAALKQLAVDYAHPELPVVTSDPTATARCYFDRASAPEQEDMEDVEYRRQVLADAAALKQLAVDYAHPELPVVTSDPTATARCYFDRASAPQPSSVNPPASKSEPVVIAAAPKKVVDKNPTSDSQTAIKTLDTSKSTDIVRSLSSVKLFGLDGEGDASY